MRGPRSSELAFRARAWTACLPACLEICPLIGSCRWRPGPGDLIAALGSVLSTIAGRPRAACTTGCPSCARIGQEGEGEVNRLPRAVERTVPFGMIVQSMVTVWYTLHGYDPADVTDRAIAQPWYRTKTEPSFEDMILKLRKTIIAARFTTVTPGQPDPDLLHDYALACAAAAA
jgi:hypothetical protein